jgi:endonuclease YncB( thermonuclease family)
MMFTLLALSLVVSLQDVKCKAGQVLAVEHGRDYTLDVCGVGVVALRGVEPPLRSASAFPLERGRMVGGELLGGRNVAPEAMAYLSKLVGQRITIVFDGYRISDKEGRRYGYVSLDKTLINAQMIQLGYGYAAREGSHPRRDEFIALEGVARREKVGVWSY